MGRIETNLLIVTNAVHLVRGCHCKRLHFRFLRIDPFLLCLFLCCTRILGLLRLSCKEFLLRPFFSGGGSLFLCLLCGKSTSF